MNYHDFLRAKFELVLAEIESPVSRTTFSNLFEQEIELLRNRSSDARKHALHLDRTIESVSRSLFRVSLNAGRSVLRSRFGVDRLGQDSSLLVPRVLTRGKIINDSEAEVVRAFVADQGNREVMGSGNYDRLAEILDEAGY